MEELEEEDMLELLLELEELDEDELELPLEDDDELEELVELLDELDGELVELLEEIEGELVELLEEIELLLLELEDNETELELLLDEELEELDEDEDELELLLALELELDELDEDDDELELLIELIELDEEAEALLEKQCIPHLIIRSSSTNSRSLASKTASTSFNSQISPLRKPPLASLSAPRANALLVISAASRVTGPPTNTLLMNRLRSSPSLTSVTTATSAGISPSVQPSSVPPWNPSALPLPFLLNPNESRVLFPPR
jgi:hypothetical protein